MSVTAPGAGSHPVVALACALVVGRADQGQRSPESAPRLPAWPASILGEDAGQVAAGADLELGEDLVQVVLDRLAADEQLGGDLLVGRPVARQGGDLGLLRGELVSRGDGAFAGGLAGGRELTRSPLGKSLRAHRGENLVGGAKLHARVEAPALTPQPFAVKEMSAGEFRTDVRAAEPLDCLAVESLDVVLAQQRARARLDPQRPFGAAGPRGLREL